MSRRSSFGSIRRHLRDQKSITQREAAELYGCTRLGARIADLRSEGWQIMTKMEKDRNRYGNSVQYARYIYVSEPEPEEARDA